jgi:hypothetical protein
LDVHLLFLDNIVVVLDDVLSSQVVINGLLHKLLINLLLSLILHNLLHVFHNIWKLLKNTLKCLPVILKCRHICLSHEILLDECLLEDALIVDHLASFEESLGGLIADHTVHDKVDVLDSVANLGDNISFNKSLRF